MASISDEDLRRIRTANDIVSVFGDRVPVRQRGRDFWCCCPIHEEKSPSCKIDPDSQLWHCFGCGAGGDVFSFIMKADDLSFPDAARKLADRANIHITEVGGKPSVAQGYKARLKDVCKETAIFYHMQLMRGKDAAAAAARSYLSGRNFGGETPKEWSIGFASGKGDLIRHLRARGFKDKELIDANVALQAGGPLKERFFNRIMFPIADAQGDIIAFGGRIIGEGQPKYLNSQETPIFHKSEVLFGLDKGKGSLASTGTAIVVEGYTDVIALHNAGITNVVATLGTALTNQHIRTLARHAKHRIIYLFDGDEAGQRAADRALSFIDENITPEAGRSKIELLAVTLPDNLDPADFVSQKGADALRALFNAAEPLLQYGIDRRLAKYDLGSAESRSRALNDALSILAPIKNSLLAKDYAVQIAGRVRAREDDVLERLSHLEVSRQAAREQESIQRNTNASASSAGRQVSSLPQTEINRRRFEREFLSLCTRFPEIALANVEVLASTQWHENIHSLLAESILASFSANPAASAAEIVTAAQEKVPSAASILTSGVMSEATEPTKLIVFLVEELSIGDLEDAIASLRAQLERPENLSAEDQEMLFASVVAMQKDLKNRRAAHRPLVG